MNTNQHFNKFENICKYWIKNKCNHENCKFIHDPDLCLNFYNNLNCNGLCNKNHFITPLLLNNNNINNNQNNKNNKKKKFNKPKNTETFEPNYSVPEMRVLFEYGKSNCELSLQSNDLIIVPDLFLDKPDLYNQLLNEIFNTKFNINNLIIPWHEGCHKIIDDHLDWKKHCPTFQYVVNKLCTYFNMKLNTTRFNWMQNLNDHKFFHFDGAALKPDIAKKQNSTIGVSFGYTRDIAFQVASHPNCRKVISVPLPNGYTYCFNKDVNIDWRHGVLPIKTPSDYIPSNTDGRISIILWGWIDQIDMLPNNSIAT